MRPYKTAVAAIGGTMSELDKAKDELERCYKAFKQFPTPSLGVILKRLQNRVKRLERA